MKRCLLALLFLFTALEASPKVCLNMIVKDERPVVTRALASVKPFIDYWVIVDTGSSDGTQQTIREYMKDIPGELHERPWVNFGHNRNEAMQLAKGKGDYLLFIDADEVLQGSFNKDLLTKAAYLVQVRTTEDSALTFQRALLINNKLRWSWRGVLHEKLECPDETPFEVLSNLTLSAMAQDGHRSQDPQKFLKDAQMLEKALLDEPDNADYVFYLAQTYSCANDLPKALQNYKRRAAMQGWDQQTFWAKYCAATYSEQLGEDPDHFIHAYCDAFQFRPSRAEPIYRLALYFHNEKNYLLGYLLSRFGLTLPKPEDIMFIEDAVYSYGLQAIFANCALRLGKTEEAAVTFDRIGQNPNAPESMRKEALSTKRHLAAEKLFVNPLPKL